MRSTDFPFAVTPQRLQRGGKFSVDYTAPSADVADLLDPTGIVGRGRLESRDTSWRDKLKDELAVRLGRRNAEQMMQVLDFTPVGAAFVGNEAALAAREGKRGEAAANVALAALPIPGAGKAAKKVAKSPLAVKPQGITAYHGSPHTFDRFDMSKIGTGEGAQAYGHGLYFAENEDVAQGYRDALTKGAMNSIEFKKIGLSPNDRAHAMTFARTTNNLFPEVAARDFANYSGKELTPDLIEAFRKTMDVPKGSMYQVRIDADPADFLNYDAPLSRQKKAFEAVRRFADDTFSGDAFDLQDMLAIKNTKAGDILKQMERTAENSERAAEVLKKAGVPGIKYLDQGSRGAGNGTRNYVVFDDKLVSILKRYGWAPGMAIPAAAMAEYEAEQEFARGGLAVTPGNYDEKVRLLREYGMLD
jgi:hypothetical protein